MARFNIAYVCHAKEFLDLSIHRPYQHLTISMHFQRRVLELNYSETSTCLY